MTSVAIAPIQAENGHIFFNAIAGHINTQGKTAGEALDALNEQLSDNDKGTLVIVQNYRSDQFFGSLQQKRLGELMKLWRIARDRGDVLPQVQQDELDSLVEQELRASAKRAINLKAELTK